MRAEPPEGSRLRLLAVVTVDLSEPAEATMLFETYAAIGGTITSEAGGPAAGANVCANPTSHAAPVCVRTATDGTYRIEAPAGTYKIHVDGPPDGSRLVPQWARGRIASSEADVIDTRNGDAGGVDLVLLRGVVLSGTVRGARDGAVLKEAQICTSTLAAPLGWDCDRADEDGRYSALRTPGQYWVWVIPPDGAGRLLPQRYDRVDLGVDATPLRLDRDVTLDVALRDGHLLSGRIVRADGEPVAAALVCVDTAPFPSGRICRPTASDGTYSVATRTDVFFVQVLPPVETEAVGGYWNGKRDWTEGDRVVMSGDRRLDIVLPRGVRVSGTVRTEDGVPVESAPVNVSDARGFLVGTYTDGAGEYALALQPGRYTIDVFRPFASQLVSRVGLPLRVDAAVGFDVMLEFARP